MAADYSRFVALSVKMIDKYGRLVDVQRLSNASGDPDKPWDGPGTPTVAESKQVPAVFVPASGSGLGTDLVSEDLLKRAEQVALVAPTDVNLETFNVIQDTGQRWKIEWVQVLRPGPIIVLYVFGVKR